jgi:hypothetical protein
MDQEQLYMIEKLSKTIGAIDSTRRALRVATFESQSLGEDLNKLSDEAERVVLDLERALVELRYNFLKSLIILQ